MRNTMQKTVVINNILIHKLDMEHGHVLPSNTFVDLQNDAVGYYDKKLEKCLSSSKIRELVVGSQHHLITAAKKMLESEEDYIRESAQIAHDLFDLCTQVDEMPVSDLMFADCSLNGARHMVVMKVNYKMVPVCRTDSDDDGNQKIYVVSQAMLPTAGAAVDEAIIINMETGELSIIEKQYMIDGKKGYYLNEQYIKGESKLSDKEIFNTLNKVAKNIDIAFGVVEGDVIPYIRKEIIDTLMDHSPVKPLEILKKVFAGDAQACDEAEIMMMDLGIEEDTVIENVPVSVDRMSRCKIVLDGDRVIEMDINDYLERVNMKEETDNGGFTRIVLSDIRDITVK